MKLISTLLLLIISFYTTGQDLVSGIITDQKTKEPLAYVNLGVLGESIGTVSDINGKFQIVIPNTHNTDTLKISMVGYESISIIVAIFKEEMKGDPVITMNPKVTQLREMVVFSTEMKEKVLGNTTTSMFVNFGFTSDDLGNEIGVKIKIKRAPTYIQNFKLNITNNPYDTARFRLNFYDIKDRMPNNRITSENIIIETTIKSGLLDVDLDRYNITAYDDFFVTIEWIEDLGKDLDEEGLNFSASFLGTPIYVRGTSQADWVKFSSVSIGIHVKVRY